MTTLALDLSSTATGICETDGTTWTFKPKGTLLARAQATRAAVVVLLEPWPDTVVLEAIGTRHTNTAIAIATVHALVRDAIDDAPVNPDIILVPPAKLKKWATGKGNADKTTMVTAAMRAGWDAPADATDDQADAWWLWTIGEALGGTWRVPETAYRAEVLDGLREALA
jgi:Holliday junction resolvasome RuvABC endonuclease subunit